MDSKIPTQETYEEQSWPAQQRWRDLLIRAVGLGLLPGFVFGAWWGIGVGLFWFIGDTIHVLIFRYRVHNYRRIGAGISIVQSVCFGATGPIVAAELFGIVAAIIILLLYLIAAGIGLMIRRHEASRSY